MTSHRFGLEPSVGVAPPRRLDQLPARDRASTTARVAARDRRLVTSTRPVVSRIPDDGRAEHALRKPGTPQARGDAPRSCRQSIPHAAKAPFEILRGACRDRGRAPNGYALRCTARWARAPAVITSSSRTRPIGRASRLPTLTYHEALPGHVWQGRHMRRESPEIPLIRRSASALCCVGEGWAAVLEPLADELGAYEHDRLGSLSGTCSRCMSSCGATGGRLTGTARAQITKRTRDARQRLHGPGARRLPAARDAARNRFAIACGARPGLQPDSTMRVGYAEWTTTA
jgi:hypothetical protein